MPRKPRPPEEVAAFQNRILDTALHLIVRDGFANLSMRKIAAELGTSATTIYNYYSNREELYFMIRIRAFDMMFESMTAATAGTKNSKEMLKLAIEQFFRFGMEYPDHYDIMFLDRNVPKYLDCIGTDLEPLASREKESTLRIFRVTIQVLEDIGTASANGKKLSAKELAMRLWCDVNGVVSLYNSRLLNEVDKNPKKTIGRMAVEIYRRYSGTD
ncbi:MAG TPA: TetR/AcrR family transcriptional regulator [Spirochaetota bacterium]|nr:TetR/AcrR family transcriptional regulator [Spirochaetota bacterium]HPI91211.1 TetR/AcrR family transcriptional regulator [Spirochaetota bacterium]HPR48362.1 TetR/AcrR family transcriptional regulator [Spirochaetota bacterium]